MKIIWTKTARVSFEVILSYLKENFSEKTVEEFIDETDKKSRSGLKVGEHQAKPKA